MAQTIYTLVTVQKDFGKITNTVTNYTNLDTAKKAFTKVLDNVTDRFDIRNRHPQDIRKPAKVNINDDSTCAEIIDMGYHFMMQITEAKLFNESELDTSIQPLLKDSKDALHPKN